MNFEENLIYRKKYMGIGRRKQAIARVFLIPGFGNFIINKMPGEQYLPVSYTHLRAHETEADLVCRLLLEKKK